MNLRVLREMKWMAMWKKIAVKELETMQYTQLADQVRLNDAVHSACRSGKTGLFHTVYMCYYGYCSLFLTLDQTQVKQLMYSLEKEYVFLMIC